MHLSGLDVALSVAALVANLALLGVFLWRKTYRALPIFAAFILFGTISDPVLYYAVGVKHVDALTYFRIFSVISVPEYLFELGVLLEIATGILRPVKRSLPSGALMVFTVMLISGALVAFIFASHISVNDLTTLGAASTVLRFAFAILRLLVFCAIALFAQILGIGWRNRVLQVATGLASYSTVALMVEICANYLKNDNLIVAYSAILSITGVMVTGYWILSFIKEEAPRKEFSPQMTRILVSISGAAKRNREAVARLNNK